MDQRRHPAWSQQSHLGSGQCHTVSVHHYGRGAGGTFAEWAYEIPVSPLTLCMVPQSDASSSRFLMSLSLATAALRNIPGTPGYGETSCRLTLPSCFLTAPIPLGGHLCFMVCHPWCTGPPGQQAGPRPPCSTVTSTRLELARKAHNPDCLPTLCRSSPAPPQQLWVCRGLRSGYIQFDTHPAPARLVVSPPRL